MAEENVAGPGGYDHAIERFLERDRPQEAGSFRRLIQRACKGHEAAKFATWWASVGFTAGESQGKADGRREARMDERAYCLKVIEQILGDIDAVPAGRSDAVYVRSRIVSRGKDVMDEVEAVQGAQGLAIPVSEPAEHLVHPFATVNPNRVFQIGRDDGRREVIAELRAWTIVNGRLDASDRRVIIDAELDEKLDELEGGGKEPEETESS